MIRLNKISKQYQVSHRRDHAHEDMSMNLHGGSVIDSMVNGSPIKMLVMQEHGVQRHLKKLDRRFIEKLNDEYHRFNGYDDYLDEWWQD